MPKLTFFDKVTQRSRTLSKRVDQAARHAAPMFSLHDWTWATTGGEVPSALQVREEFAEQVWKLMQDDELLAVECGRLRVERRKDWGRSAISYRFSVVVAD